MITVKSQEIVPMKRVQTISELLLLDAINTVGMAFYNIHLDASDVKVLKAVMNTHPYAHMLEKVGKGGMELADTTPVQVPDMPNVEYLDRALKLEFNRSGEATNNEWIFVRTPLQAENELVFRGFFCQGYLQVVAYVFLYNYVNKKHIKLSVIEEHLLEDNNGVATKNKKATYSEMEYTQLILLRDRGNKVLIENGPDANFSLLFSDKPGCSQDWAAYCISYRMQGLFAEKYSSKVKFNYFKSRFAVGDVILVYSRIAGVKKNNAQSYKYVNTCYPAVVLEVTPTHVSFIKYMCIKTKLTAYKQYQDMVSRGGGSLLVADEVYAFPTAPCKRKWEEIGIEGYSFNENEIIVEPMEDDGSVQYIGNDHLFLNTLETIYAVFEDRNVSYNKERFLTKYFKGQTPIYDQIMMKMKKQQ